jgi:hypothetical protein
MPKPKKKKRSHGTDEPPQVRIAMILNMLRTKSGMKQDVLRTVPWRSSET